MLNYQRVSGKMWVNPWVNRMGWKTIWWGFRWPIHSRFTNFVACFEESVVSNWPKDWIFWMLCYIILYYSVDSETVSCKRIGIGGSNQLQYCLGCLLMSCKKPLIRMVQGSRCSLAFAIDLEPGGSPRPTGITLESTSKYMLCWVQISLSFKSRTVLAAMSNFNSGDCHWKLVLVNQVLQPSGVYIHPSMHACMHTWIRRCLLIYLLTYLPTIYTYIHTLTYIYCGICLKLGRHYTPHGHQRRISAVAGPFGSSNCAQRQMTGSQLRHPRSFIR